MSDAEIDQLLIDLGGVCRCVGVLVRGCMIVWVCVGVCGCAGMGRWICIFWPRGGVCGCSGVGGFVAGSFTSYY